MSKQAPQHPWKRRTAPSGNTNPDRVTGSRECQGVHVHKVESVPGHDFCSQCLYWMNSGDEQ